MAEETTSVNEEVASPQDEMMESSPSQEAEKPENLKEAEGSEQQEEQYIPKSRFDEVNNKYKALKEVEDVYQWIISQDPNLANQFATPSAFVNYAVQRAIWADSQLQNQAAQKQPAAKEVAKVEVEEEGEEGAEEDKYGKRIGELEKQIQVEREQKIVADCQNAYVNFCKKENISDEQMQQLYPYVENFMWRVFQTQNADINNPSWYPDPKYTTEVTKQVLDNLKKISLGQTSPPTKKPTAPPTARTVGKTPPPTKERSKDARVSRLAQALKPRLG